MRRPNTRTRRPAHMPTPRSGRAWRGLVVLAAAGLVGACLARPGSSAADGLAAEATLLAHIQAEVGDAVCSSDTQCQTLAIGAKACGGPARWLAWSSATAARPAQLSAWSVELATLQRSRFQASGMMSTCSIVPDPGAVCLAGRCSLNTSSLGR